MSNVKASISFQYMEPGDEKPSAGYEITDVSLAIPANGHVPRVGEVLSYFPSNHGKTEFTTYVVLSVCTSISVKPDDHREITAWHTTVTVGPASQVDDPRHLIIRE